MHVDKFTTSFTVSSVQVNCFGEATLPALFFAMQEAAWEHAEQLGLGFERLLSEGVFWAMSRIAIEVNVYPKWRQHVIMKTWPRDTDGFMAYRDFSLEDEYGTLLLAATSSWIVIDSHTHRLRRLSSLTKEFPYHAHAILNRNAEKLGSAQNYTYGPLHPVLFSETDLNKHLNSGRTIERFMDAHDSIFLLNNTLKSFEINYLREGTLDSALQVGISNIQLHEFGYTLKSATGTEIARAIAVWQPSVLKS